MLNKPAIIRLLTDEKWKHTDVIELLMMDRKTWTAEEMAEILSVFDEIANKYGIYPEDGIKEKIMYSFDCSLGERYKFYQYITRKDFDGDRIE